MVAPSARIAAILDLSELERDMDMNTGSKSFVPAPFPTPTRPFVPGIVAKPARRVTFASDSDFSVPATQPLATQPPSVQAMAATFDQDMARWAAAIPGENTLPTLRAPSPLPDLAFLKSYETTA